jgi:hypothetical protein
MDLDVEAIDLDELDLHAWPHGGHQLLWFMADLE